jgi:hypothetical protein
MHDPIELTPGTDAAQVSPAKKQKRIGQLRATVAKYLPDFPETVKQMQTDKGMLILHQDAFAAGFDRDEYTLLGMAIKFAGLHGVEVTVIGRNHETF